jgi:hypothetical protein
MAASLSSSDTCMRACVCVGGGRETRGRSRKFNHDDQGYTNYDDQGYTNYDDMVTRTSELETGEMPIGLSDFVFSAMSRKASKRLTCNARLLQKCYKSVTRVLRECSRAFGFCFLQPLDLKGVIKVLSKCYHIVIKVLMQ